MIRKTAVAAVIALALTWSGVTSAAPWTNLAYSSVATTTDGSSLNNLASPGNARWHQNGSSLWSPTNPCYVVFDLGAGNETSIGYIRWYNITDHVGGTFTGYVQALLPGGDPSNPNDWTKIVDAFTMNGTADSQQFSVADFVGQQAVTTRALRWVLTDTNDGKNFRVSKFEFSEGNLNTLNLANMPGATLTWCKAGDDANAIPIPMVHNGLPGMTRFNSNYPGSQGVDGQQFVTLTLPTAMNIEHLRVAAEDGNHYIGLFSIEYLAADGVTWKTATGPGGQSYANLTGQLNVADYDLAIPATTGLRLNIINPSDVNHNILRLYEFAAYGTPIPEPATMTLLALGGLAMLRRRK